MRRVDAARYSLRGEEAPADLQDGAWVLEPREGGLARRLVEVWRYRRLIWYFAAQTLGRTYRKTVLGWAWVVIRPVTAVASSTFIFGNVVGIEVGELPYVLFFLVGVGCWNLFENSLMWATRSLELNRRILEKQYLPRLMLPIASVAPALVEFLVYVALIVGAVMFYAWSDGRIYLGSASQILIALVAVVLCLLLAIGIGLWTSVIAVRARDVRLALTYVLKPWFVVTPVIYPLSSVPSQWQWLIVLNPMATLVELFKWGTLGVGHFDGGALATAVLLVGVVLISGLAFFGYAEGEAVDQM